MSASIGASCTLSYQGRCLDLDALIVRGLGQGMTVETLEMRRGVLEAAEDQGVAVVNPPSALFKARDKFRSLRLLAKHGIPVPRTIVTENIGDVIRFVEEMGAAVIKPLIGSLGLGSFKVEDADSAYHVATLIKRTGQPIYVQEYIEKRDNMDLRVFVVDGKPLAAIYRHAAQGAWKTNIARGGRPLPAHPRRELLEAAVKATEILGLDYAGVDIVESTSGEYYVVEVNASPLWRGLYKATGIDPAPYIVEAALSKARK